MRRRCHACDRVLGLRAFRNETFQCECDECFLMSREGPWVADEEEMSEDFAAAGLATEKESECGPPIRPDPGPNTPLVSLAVDHTPAVPMARPFQVFHRHWRTRACPGWTPFFPCCPPLPWADEGRLRSALEDRCTRFRLWRPLPHFCALDFGTHLMVIASRSPQLYRGLTPPSPMSLMCVRGNWPKKIQRDLHSLTIALSVACTSCEHKSCRDVDTPPPSPPPPPPPTYEGCITEQHLQVKVGKLRCAHPHTRYRGVAASSRHVPYVGAHSSSATPGVVAPGDNAVTALPNMSTHCTTTGRWTPSCWEWGPVTVTYRRCYRPKADGYSGAHPLINEAGVGDATTAKR